MVLSRSQGKVAFDHILDTVLDCSSSSGLKQALIDGGYTSIVRLLCMDYADIDTLTYNVQPVGGVAASIPVSQAERDSLKMFFKYVADRQSQGNSIGDDWMSITPDDFDTFCLRGDVLSARLKMPTVKSPPQLQMSQVHVSPAVIVHRVKKQDSSPLPTLKDERSNDSQNQSFVTEARTQDVSEIFVESQVHRFTDGGCNLSAGQIDGEILRPSLCPPSSVVHSRHPTGEVHVDSDLKHIAPPDATIPDVPLVDEEDATLVDVDVEDAPLVDVKVEDVPIVDVEDIEGHDLVKDHKAAILGDLDFVPEATPYTVGTERPPGEPPPWIHFTHFARTSFLLKRAFGSLNPAPNFCCHSDSVACDIVYSNTPANDNRSSSTLPACACNTAYTRTGSFLRIPGEMNPADTFSKHLGYSQLRSRLRDVFF